ncbi:MAG: spore maturation protein [Candidatus Gastranaerophilales bacterium]|nr:spore maturation protein [Candidatus Gastranaerophilales bacterium]
MINFLNALSVYILPLIIAFILVYALIKKTPAYEDFTQGAVGGFNIAIKIIPYLIAIMVCTAALRASGAIELMQNILSPIFNYFKIPIETAIIMLTRSLSGSATLGVLADIINQTGVNSYATKLAAVITGSSETTFYVASVYFGAVGIKKFRHALLAGILADIVGLIAAIWICSIFFL